jgi:hypothetical protein
MKEKEKHPVLLAANAVSASLVHIVMVTYGDMSDYAIPNSVARRKNRPLYRQIFAFRKKGPDCILSHRT